MQGQTGSVDVAEDVRRAAFRALLAAGRVDLGRCVAWTNGLSAERVRLGARMLADRGAMVLEGEQVIGVAGLSVRPTRHRVELAARDWHTWCAYDAVGIPAAMAADAVVHTCCPWCADAITVPITAGRPSPASTAVGWLPRFDGTDPIRRFCPLANLFCDERHLTGWRRDSGDPDGRTSSLDELADRGVGNWGPLL